MAQQVRILRWIPFGVFTALVVGLVIFWDWNWFRPIVESQASQALGRDVKIGNIGVSLGWTTTVTLDDVTVGNPPGFGDTPPLAQVGSLSVQADVQSYLQHRSIVIPKILLNRPRIEAVQETKTKANWNFDFPASKPGTSAPNIAIGNLEIDDGDVHFVSAPLKADVKMAVHTTTDTGGQAGAPGEDGRIEATARGTYAGQLFTGHFVGGTLLSLRDAEKPYPVDLHVENGATRVDLVGTVQDPIKFAGAKLRLTFAGQDMSQLYPLTGVPIPQTPPFHIAGQLDLAGHTIKFSDFTGSVGSSDLEGAIDVTLRTNERPLVSADLRSRRVDLTDLGGFIGSTPGRRGTPGESVAQREQIARSEASPKLLPTTPINMPKLLAADVRLTYHGAHIEGKSVPLDDIVVTMDITDGNIKLDPLNFGVGTGAIASKITLSPLKSGLHAVADVDFRRVDLSRLLEATHVVHGGGVIGGSANIDSTGDSLSQLLGDGNGGVRMFMAGGNLSALLVDLSGLEFGNALLSALGIPNQATVRCFIGDLALVHGVLQTKVLALDTSESNVYGSGDIDLRRETLDYRLQTKATHFTIGSLPTPIDITGTFKDPSIRPEVGALAARAGAAIGLGILFPPLALLPTIQLGLGDHNDCAHSFGGHFETTSHDLSTEQLNARQLKIHNAGRTPRG